MKTSQAPVPALSHEIHGIFQQPLEVGTVIIASLYKTLRLKRSNSMPTAVRLWRLSDGDGTRAQAERRGDEVSFSYIPQSMMSTHLRGAGEGCVQRPARTCLPYDFPSVIHPE